MTREIMLEAKRNEKHKSAIKGGGPIIRKESPHGKLGSTWEHAGIVLGNEGVTEGGSGRKNTRSTSKLGE